MSKMMIARTIAPPGVLNSLGGFIYGLSEDVSKSYLHLYKDRMRLVFIVNDESPTAVVVDFDMKLSGVVKDMKPHMWGIDNDVASIASSLILANKSVVVYFEDYHNKYFVGTESQSFLSLIRGVLYIGSGGIENFDKSEWRKLEYANTDLAKLFLLSAISISDSKMSISIYPSELMIKNNKVILSKSGTIFFTGEGKNEIVDFIYGISDRDDYNIDPIEKIPISTKVLYGIITLSRGPGRKIEFYRTNGLYSSRESTLFLTQSKSLNGRIKESVAVISLSMDGVRVYAIPISDGIISSRPIFPELKKKKNDLIVVNASPELILSSICTFRGREGDDFSEAFIDITRKGNSYRLKMGSVHAGSEAVSIECTTPNWAGQSFNMRLSTFVNPIPVIAPIMRNINRGEYDGTLMFGNEKCEGLVGYCLGKLSLISAVSDYGSSLIVYLR